MKQINWGEKIKSALEFILAVAVLANLFMVSVAINGNGASPKEAAVLAAINLAYLLPKVLLAAKEEK